MGLALEFNRVFFNMEVGWIKVLLTAGRSHQNSAAVLRMMSFVVSALLLVGSRAHKSAELILGLASRH